MAARAGTGGDPMEGMKVVYSGTVQVSYGQIYAASPGCAPVLLETSLAGQANGLCGAGVAGGLMLMCGLHTGRVQLEVLWFPAEPPVEAAWPEIVEAPFRYLSSPVTLSDWDGNPVCTLPIEGPGCMVRWCARNFGEAEDAGRLDDDEPFEEYALHLWPASRQQERVVRETSERARYWHSHAQTLHGPR